MEGKDVTTSWGKIGTSGQTKTKSFADEAKAKKEYVKLLEEKTTKGYVEKERE
jgi:predicted DNA-binding WGR domain protein